jgi:GNAT superfamily N-acetyltransferase
MTITFRPGTFEDTYTTYHIFEQTLLDLSRRTGAQAITDGQDPASLEQLWIRRRPLFEHLARAADQFWLAERDGQVIGYARSILRDGLRELTEFFVLPGQQSSGVGRQLLERAFPREGAHQRAIIATTDTRAMVLYLKTGVNPRFPIMSFTRQPEPVAVQTDLVFEPAFASPETLAVFGVVDAAVLGHRRDIDHAWLLSNRQGYIYRRAGQPVGYGYVGLYSGPFALLDERDFPAVLAHAETQAVGQIEKFALDVPLVNRSVVNYLFWRNFHMESFLALFLCTEPFGRFENYIVTAPPFFL